MPDEAPPSTTRRFPMRRTFISLVLALAATPALAGGVM
ncbi:DUF4440 domain-containing protein, partial [Xanthomonas hortorum pv. vitians]|nr:DUF4440 domain-containing protein [Xanthomonas hortorum pv. vitians]MCE4365597.1 DUF4440 domain-containing protein [Xanthomonas hortorum pv. vitians]MCE4528483.1 DUF4440 domain-containing protein [Xanthomonas hortorum pv. vitians]